MCKLLRNYRKLSRGIFPVVYGSVNLPYGELKAQKMSPPPCRNSTAYMVTAGSVPKAPHFQTVKTQKRHRVTVRQVLKEPTLYILLDLTPPPLKTGLNKVYLLICDRSRSWPCGHFHGRPGSPQRIIHCLRLV